MALRFLSRLPALAKRRDLLLGVPALGLLLAGLTTYVFYPAWQAGRHWKQAEQAIETRDYAQACQHLEKYLAANRNHAEARFLLARTQRRAGRLDEARSTLARAQRLDWVPEQIELEETLLQVQQSGPSAAQRDRLLALAEAGHPDERLILEALARGEREALQFDHAGKTLNLWVERFPDDWLARLWRAEQLQAFTHFDEARADYLKVLELRPDHDEAHLSLGLLALANRAQFEEAETHLRKYLDRHPHHAEAMIGLARIRRERGDLEAAADTLKQVLDAHPDHAEAALLAGTVEGERSRYDAALPWLRRAEQGGADFQTTQFQLALVLKRLGKTQEAEEYERRFRVLEKLQPALDAALLAVLKDPGNPARQYEIGRLYAETGQGAKAERYFFAALRLDAKHRPSHEALADYYTRSNRPGDAALAEAHRRMAKGQSP